MALTKYKNVDDINSRKTGVGEFLEKEDLFVISQNSTEQSGFGLCNNDIMEVTLYDVNNNLINVLRFTKGLYCGENHILNDKYILSIIFNSYTEKSEIHIYDLKTFDNEPILKINLPVKIPFCFHGLFID